MNESDAFLQVHFRDNPAGFTCARGPMGCFGTFGKYRDASFFVLRRKRNALRPRA